MNMSQYLFAGTASLLTLLMLGVAVRMFLGPTAPDRIVALDTFNTLISAIMMILAAVYDSVVILDVAIVYMALSFVGTLYFARYLEGGV